MYLTCPLFETLRVERCRGLDLHVYECEIKWLGMSLWVYIQCICTYINLKKYVRVYVWVGLLYEHVYVDICI